jgi:hypothetical protein
MSSESVCQVARSWVDMGNFHTCLVVRFMIFYGISPEYLRYTLIRKKELCCLSRMCILRPWLQVPSVMRVVAIEVSHDVATVIYFSDLGQSAQSTSCLGYTINVCVNSLARLLEGNIGI